MPHVGRTLQQREVEMLKCYTQIWTSSLGLRFPQTLIWESGGQRPICLMKLPKKRHQTEIIGRNPELRHFICSLFCHTLDQRGLMRQVSPPLHQSPPHIKTPVNRARLRAYTVCSAADRNAGQAAVWLSGYSECCGGG